MNVFEFTIRQVTSNTGAGWIAVTRDHSGQLLDGTPLPWRVLKGGQLITESEHDFLRHFRLYLPWSECGQVTFGEGFLDRGSRVHFAVRDNNRAWVPQFQA